MNSRITVLLAIAVFAAGCGGGGNAGNREPVFPITGKLMYKGRPVENADVTFFCKEKDRSAFGRTDSSGEFKLTTYTSNDGAIAGKHVVVVNKIDVPSPGSQAVVYDVSDPRYVPPPSTGPGSVTPPPKKQLPARYADVKTSDLIAVVSGDGGPNDMTLELKD